MTSYHKTEGFVFKKEDILEADRMFSVFTKDFGRLEVFGKAIRKINSKLRSGVEIFSLSEIEFVEGKSKKTLIDAVSKNTFKNIPVNPERFLLANKISGLLDQFIRGQEIDQEILNLTTESFEKLNDLSIQHKLIYGYFFWNFVSLLGYHPELFHCAICQQKLNPYGLFFSAQDGGIICKRCAANKKNVLKVKSDIVKILRIILKKDWNMVSRLRIEEGTQVSLSEVSNHYYQLLAQTYANN